MGRVHKLLALACMVFVSLSIGRVLAAPPDTSTGRPRVAELPGVALHGADVTIGTGADVGNLTVFPIYGVSDPRFDDVISLESALRRGKAEVRERRDKPAPSSRPRTARHRGVPPQQAVEPDVGSGATVGTLVIENKAKRPILVLAGTVVKGGNQDRQIAQDFIIGGGETVPVDAFCVEQGRWSGTRDGRATAGKFTSVGMLAPAQVRSAAQYEGDQGKVWKKVGEVNASHRKTASSGTLMATYGDKDVGKRRDGIVKAARDALASAPAAGKIVGVAYAVDGHVRGARWFMSRALFEQHRDALLGTAAVEAMTARADGGGRRARAAKASAVRDFVDAVRKSKIKRTAKTRSKNSNRYRESAKGYSAETVLDDEAAPLTVDVLAK